MQTIKAPLVNPSPYLEPASAAVPAGGGEADPATVTQAVRVAANAMFIAGRDGRICWVNWAFTRLFGYSAEEALGNSPRILKSGRQSADYYRELWDTISAGRVWRGHLSNRRKGGAIFDVEQTITPVRDARGDISHYLAVYEDITERLRSEQRIERLAMFDSVTGLPNRNQFHARLTEALARSRRSGRALGVMLVDLDHFKNVNDTLGHAGGDELLGQIGRCMSGVLRDTDVVSRLSGDEFAVLIENLVRPEQALDSAQRLLDVLHLPFKVMGATLRTGASIGIAISGDSEDTPERLLRNADLAMYQAKTQGRGRFQFFDAAMDLAARRRHALEQALRQALREDTLELVYQPQVDMRTGDIVGAEALLRWNDPAGGRVPTAELIAIATQSGMILAVDDWVLRQATRQLAELRRQSPHMPPLAVNLSAAQLDRVGLAGALEDALRQNGLPAAALSIEISETLMLRPSLVVHENLRALTRMGVGIGIDDFGTGHSSLPALREFPLDSIKLDSTYVRGIGHSRRDEQLLRGMIGLAGHLDLRVLAEGIETREQRDFLLREGCTLGQGHLFERELSAGDFLELLRAARS